MLYTPYSMKKEGLSSIISDSKNKNGAGLTLIEMMVVGTIFCLIIATVLGIFSSAIRAQRFSLASQQLIDQTSYVMEYMSRFLRMAKKELDAGGPTACLSANGLNYEKTYGDSGLKFKNYKGECQEFYLDTDRRLYQTIDTIRLPLTSEKFNVKNLRFSVSGQTQADNVQPKVTIFLEVEGKGNSPQPKIRIQTTTSQRDIDVLE